MKQLFRKRMFTAISGWACISSAADTIRIAYSSINPHALLVSLAEKRGLFAKYGLSSVVVYIPGGSTVVQAMVSGDVDLGQLTGAPGVAANLRGADIVYIAMTDDKMGYQLVDAQRYKKPGRTQGKTTGYQSLRIVGRFRHTHASETARHRSERSDDSADRQRSGASDGAQIRQHRRLGVQCAVR